MSSTAETEALPRELLLFKVGVVATFRLPGLEEEEEEGREEEREVVEEEGREGAGEGEGMGTEEDPVDDVATAAGELDDAVEFCRMGLIPVGLLGEGAGITGVGGVGRTAGWGRG